MAEKSSSDHAETGSSILQTEPEAKENVPAGHVPVTVEEKILSRALNRKLDVFLLPFLSLLYLFNGLDRGNVGNAETQGMLTPWLNSLAGFLTTEAGFTKDIGAQPDDLNLAVSLFFITFVLFQPLSAAVGRWLGANKWIPIIMVQDQPGSQFPATLLTPN